MRRIKEALEQARQDGILAKSSVVDGIDRIGGEPQERVKTSPPENTSSYRREAPNFASIDLNTKILKKNHVFRGRETDSFSMAYKMLRTQVYQKMQQNNWSTLGVTSSSTGEGKSLTALNLAFSLARASARPIVLVDLDLRRPSLVDKLGISTQLGVTDFLLRDYSLEKVLLRLSDNLILAPGVESIKDASEILGSVVMVKLMRKLKDLCPDSLVIFDLPPVLVVDDVMALSPLIDACLMVAEEGQTKENDLEQALDLLEMTNLLGIVLNKSGEIEKNHYYSSY